LDRSRTHFICLPASNDKYRDTCNPSDINTDSGKSAFNQPSFIWKLRGAVSYDVAALSSRGGLNREGRFSGGIKRNKAVHSHGRTGYTIFDTDDRPADVGSSARRKTAAAPSPSEGLRRPIEPSMRLPLSRFKNNPVFHEKEALARFATLYVAGNVDVSSSQVVYFPDTLGK